MFTFSQFIRPLGLLVIILVLSACGGGSSDVTHTVSATSSIGGSISPTSQAVAYGATATFTVTPETGYSIDSVNGCGGSLDGNTYSTGIITGACTVNVSFSLLPSAPPNLQGTAADRAVLLHWAHVPGADSYNLYHATAGGIQPANFGIWISQHDGAMIENAVSPHTVEGLDNGTEYFFVVEATAGGQVGEPSNEVSAVPQESPFVTGKLNDTGITWSGDAIDVNAATCDPVHPAGQDCHYGRDAQAAAGKLTKVGGGSAGFDFTKIANNGSVLPASATLGSGPNDWACTRDNVTGLIWEVKLNNSAHLRHHFHTYTWYDPNSPDGNAGTQNGGTCTDSNCDTTGFVQAVNAQGLCGSSDWRMPTWRELQGIIDFGRREPTIDTGYFPNTGYSPPTPTLQFWSGSPSAIKTNDAWLVNFDYGFAAALLRSNGWRVRLVRGGQ